MVGSLPPLLSWSCPPGIRLRAGSHAMHKTEIINPAEAGRRLVNSMMLGTEGEEIGKDQQEALVHTKEISKKIEYRN